MMWRMAQFSGVEIFTYVVMDNHFHILLKVPDCAKWLGRFETKAGEEKLLSHLSTVYSKAFLKQLGNELKSFRERGMARYRLYLFDEGLSVEPESSSLGRGRRKRRGIKMEARAKVSAQKGRIPPGQLLQKRVTSFTMGVAIGGEDFVKGMASRYREAMGRKKGRIPRSIAGSEGGFFVMKE